MNDHEFLDAVAVAIIMPGPVVVTVAFIGFLVAGFAGSVMAAAYSCRFIYLPSFRALV